MLQIAIVFFLILFIIGFLGGIKEEKTLLPPLDRDKEEIKNPSLLDMMLVLGVCLIVFAFCLMLIAILLAYF